MYGSLVRLFIHCFRAGLLVSGLGNSFPIHSCPLTVFLCFHVLFHFCYSHVQVFKKTLVHEFYIYYSHTEWNLLSLPSENCDMICKQRLLNKTLNLTNYRAFRFLFGLICNMTFLSYLLIY